MVTRTTSAAVLGRRAVLDEIDSVLAAIGSGRSELVLLSGPAGIGKTTLWQAGLERARERGLTVVAAQPTEVETGLAFAALGDLLTPLLDRAPVILASMPGPQRGALEAALLRAAAPERPHPLGVSLATLHVLRAAAAEVGPLLVAVDDAPWIDEASARALEFALRRLDAEPVGFLVARRAADPAEPLPGWLATAPADRLVRIDVGPLSIDQTGALLRQHLGLGLTRPVLARLHAIAGGTPFYAIELGRDLQARGAWDTPDALAVPRALDRLVGDRIAALSPDADEVALVAAAQAHPTVGTLGAAVGVERAAAGLAEARAAGVLEVVDETVRFAHPLLAAATYGQASSERRRAVHERLAASATDPEERARHLSRTAAGPDPAVAAALEEAAAVAARRGASEVAADLAEQAARLTPPDAGDERQRRRVVAADHLIVSGDMQRADRILGDVADDLGDGPLKADVLTRRARIALYLTELDDAATFLRAAMPMTSADDRRRVTIHELLAGLGFLTWRDWRRARFHMTAALRLAGDVGDGPLELEILGHAATWRFGLGRPWRELMERADRLAVPLEAVPALEHPNLQFARLLAREGHAAEARRRIEHLTTSARLRGDWTSLPRLLVSAAGVELDAGDWDAVDRIVDEARAGLLQSGEGAFLVDLELVRLQLAVLRGDEATARASGAGLDADLRGWAQPRVRTGPPLALAQLELSLARPEAALPWIERVAAEPGLGRLLPISWESVVALEAEALVGLGRAAEIDGRVARLVRRARRRGPAAALGHALRGQALVLAAVGRPEEAVHAAEEAVACFEGLELPFAAARAWFTLGEVRRRARQRATARSAFEAALGTFTQLGAALWADRARTELERVASRRPAGAPLTDMERRVAELAGAGQTNKEIAAALFISVHTVEAHLTRIFRSLGVQSRTELARADLDAEAAEHRQP